MPDQINVASMIVSTCDPFGGHRSRSRRTADATLPSQEQPSPLTAARVRVKKDPRPLLLAVALDGVYPAHRRLVGVPSGVP
jgi:hypothetical protein